LHFSYVFLWIPLSAHGAATPVHEVQGAGASSPFTEQILSVGGIVTGSFQGRDELRGFFLQETSPDDDPATSEGIFVFHDRTEVRTGDRIDLTGRVTEYHGLTEITDVTDLQIRQRDADLPAPAEVTLPLPSEGYLERYEGMRVEFTQRLTVSAIGSLAAYGSMVLSSGRPMQPTAVAPPGAEARAVAGENSRNRLILDDGRTRVDPLPIPYPAPGMTADNPLRTGYGVTGLVGVLDFSFGQYRVHPTEPVVFGKEANPRTDAPAPPGRLRVAGVNLRNYFNGPSFPTPRGAATREAFARQHAKITAALGGMAADVVGLAEVENDGYGDESAVARLTAGLNDASPEGVSYDYIRPKDDRLGNDEITNALLYRLERVTPAAPAAALTGGVFAGSSRPALAQSFREIATGEIFTVVVNHFRSRSTPCEDDPETGGHQGNCNAERTRAAAELAAWLETAPYGVDDPDILIIGDLNAYPLEDPLMALRDAGYIDLLQTHIGPGTYTYVYDGAAGPLDHALANRTLAPQIRDVAVWHINADEPAILDYTTVRPTEAGPILYNPDPFRSSDHDPVIVSLDPGGVPVLPEDILSALKVAAGFAASPHYFPKLDVDGNQRIGLADAIGLLRLAGDE
jgi:hypothetical protein